MRTLTLSQTKLVSGSTYEANLSDALDVIAIIGGAGGIAGGIVEFSRAIKITSSDFGLFHKAFGPGIAYSTFAGIGVGVVIGAALGAALYYSGIIFKEEN